MFRLLTGLLAALLLLTACDEPAETEATAEQPGAAALAAHGEMFERRVLTPLPGVHVAVGYGLANAIMIEGQDGVVVVDTLESRPRAQQALAAFRKITQKPVRAIVLTHNHADHIFGAQVFAEGRPVPVYAHRTTSAHIDRIVNVLANTIYARSMRMFGQLLPPEEVLNAGIGPDLQVATPDLALLRPTVVFDGRMAVEIAGIRLELVHAPGETDDQLFVWLPARRVLLPADNIYRAFPNLYTIRGTAHRDVMQWVHSLDRMRDLRPQALIPSHTLPLIGEDKVAGVLTAYRDAIQYLHDQTVRGINRGLTPDELVEAVRLPPHLAGHPWLAEHYGTARWSVRAIHNGYLGWFNGDGADLDPLPATVRSRRLAEAFAAGRPLPEQARAAQQAGDHQWAAELARHWLRTEPDSDEARQLLARAFTDLAGNNANPNARHWYLTQARELRGDLQIGRPDPSELPDAMLDDLPIGAFLAGMATRLRAEETLDSDQLVRFEFTDVDRVFSAHLRRGVLAVREIATPDPEITIRTTTRTWKRIVTRKRNPALALAADEVSVDGGLIAVSRFLALFER